MACGWCYNLNLGVHKPYKDYNEYVNTVDAGLLGINTRYAWFLSPHVSRETHNSSSDQVSVSQFRPDRFADIRQHFHVNATDLAQRLGVQPEHRFVPAHCRSVACAIMLASVYSETAFVAEHIRALNVSIQVLWLANAHQLLHVRAALLNDAAAANVQKKMLFLARTPSELALTPDNSVDYSVLDLTQLEEHLTAEQKAMYRPTPMAKFTSNGPLLSHIEQFDLTGHALSLLHNVSRRMMESNASDDMADIYDNVACDWLRETDAINSDMLNISYVDYVDVGGIFPKEARYDGLLEAARMAIDVVNNIPDFLASMKLRLMSSQRTPLMSFVELSSIRTPVGAIGPDVKEIICECI